jgi:quercetin dioxygenase-like cupin family protein
VRPQLAAVAWSGLFLVLASSAGLAAPGQLALTPKEIDGLSKASGGPGSSGLPGVQSIVLFGDPKAAGPYVIALHVPAHTVIAAHTHRDSRTAAVISGTWRFGYGQVNLASDLKALPPGSFYTEPGGQPHYARTDDEPALVYITGIGPTDTVYLDAAAEPRKP